ncbi:MAG: type II toxin-antitoxin system Phd/YefM family antitoxin [Burkholderiaceae bacterium]
MQVSVADIKAKFTAIAQCADAGEEVIITNRGKPAYRLVPVTAALLRSPFPDVTALARQSLPYGGDSAGSFVADWRAQNERF